MKRDLHDRIIDQLLREILGGDRPRDMTARVMHQAKIQDRFRRRMWMGVGSALAAGVALMIGLYLYWPHEGEYPNPTIDEDISVVDNVSVQRGATFYTQEKEGHMALGGYVTLAMAPESQLNLAGSKFQEKVLLNRGELDVAVTKHKGEFDIGVGRATVHVTGTKFNVRLGEEYTSTEWRKVLQLEVKEGSVEVRDVPGAASADMVTAGGGVKTYVLEHVARNLSAGMLAAAQQSALVGARGAQVNQVRSRGTVVNVAPNPVPPVPGTSRGNSTPPATMRGTSTAPVTRGTTVPPAVTPATGDGITLRLTQGAANRIGHVQHVGTVYYLQIPGTTDANWYMFEKSMVATAHPDWVTVSADAYMRVVWAEGAVKSMEKMASTPNPAGAATQNR